MAIQIPTDASLGVQKALGDLEDWLYRIQDRLDKTPTPDDVDRRISEALPTESKQLSLDFNDVFRGGDAHALGHVPDPGVYGNSGPRYLTTDGEFAPLLDGALVSGNPGVGGSSLAQKVVEVHGSLAVTSAVQADTLYVREIQMAKSGETVTDLTFYASDIVYEPVVGVQTYLDSTTVQDALEQLDTEPLIQTLPAGSGGSSLAQRVTQVNGSLAVLGAAAAETLRCRNAIVTGRTTLSGFLSAPFVGARVYRTAVLSISDATVTVVPFTAASYDTDSFWSAGSGSRLTVPTGLAGYYFFEANVTWAATNSRAIVQIELNANGTDDAAKVLCRTDASLLGQHVSGTLYLNDGDYIECFVFQDSTGAVNLNVIGSTNHGTPSFSLVRLGT